MSIATFQSRLVRVAGDMPFAEPLTTYRLRHSFATSLMNGGMSLMGIMKLLGHRDQRMTLRYTQIADETSLIRPRRRETISLSASTGGGRGPIVGLRTT